MSIGPQFSSRIGCTHIFRLVATLWKWHWKWTRADKSNHFIQLITQIWLVLEREGANSRQTTLTLQKRTRYQNAGKAIGGSTANAFYSLQFWKMKTWQVSPHAQSKYSFYLPTAELIILKAGTWWPSFFTWSTLCRIKYFLSVFCLFLLFQQSMTHSYIFACIQNLLWLVSNCEPPPPSRNCILISGAGG